MTLFSRALPFGIVFALSGCAGLDQAIKDMEAAMPSPNTAPALIEESPLSICREAKDNQARANELYVGRGLSINGKVVSVNEGYQPRYRVYLKAGSVAVHAGTDDPAAIRNLTAGNSTNVRGTITDITHDYQGCSVALENASF